MAFDRRLMKRGIFGDRGTSYRIAGANRRKALGNTRGLVTVLHAAVANRVTVKEDLFSKKLIVHFFFFLFPYS